MTKAAATRADTLGQDVDAVVIGAGLGGLYMLHRLQEAGYSAQAFEAGSDVGGTWYWNRYPGARCDVESLDYQFGFSDALQRGWSWTERYATQPEILRYARYVADRLDVRKLIRFRTRIDRAVYDASANLWHVTTDDGRSISAHYLITAVGCLSAARIPDIPGRDAFAGASYHTGHWPHEPVDFTGQRVGVIGTGSSGIQCIPEIAQQAGELVVFQRTANFSMPAHNARLEPREVERYKDAFLDARARARYTGFGNVGWDSLPSALAVDEATRREVYEAQWRKGGAAIMVAFEDLLSDQAANDTAAEFLRGKIRDAVTDGDIAESLVPRDHPVGTKRICVDTDYFKTFNQPHVRLVNLRQTPIETITAHGVRTSDAHFDLDALVYATGFDALTGPLNRIDIRGRDGVALRSAWKDGPRTYLGLAVHGFPNLFTITGPGSPSVLSNMVVAIEQHGDLIIDCMNAQRRDGYDLIEADAKAEAAWGEHVNDVANETLFPQANSWYMGANIPGKPRVFLPYVGGLGTYIEACETIVADDFRGFVRTRSGVGASERQRVKEG